MERRTVQEYGVKYGPVPWSRVLARSMEHGTGRKYGELYRQVPWSREQTRSMECCKFSKELNSQGYREG
jgi:hypothetical protein